MVSPLRGASTTVPPAPAAFLREAFNCYRRHCAVDDKDGVIYPCALPSRQ
jgi:hypothetical protein